jgi:DNA-binding CsgD family transcriptional regulator
MLDPHQGNIDMTTVNPATNAIDCATDGLFERLEVTAGDWRLAVLDLLDYGILLLDADARAVHVNGAASNLLGQATVLRLQDGRVDPARPEDSPAWRDALHAAARRGLRSLLALGASVRRAVSVIPLPSREKGGRATILVVAGRHSLCEVLSAQWFARHNELTHTEAEVLQMLCEGLRPSDIAARQDVAISTVRTQIGSIRLKTGASSIGALLRQIALLPPMTHALQAAGTIGSGNKVNGPADG